MSKRKFRIYYYVLKGHLNLCLKSFYRRFKVVGWENVDPDVAVIFGPNHQNAFIDALNVVASTNKERQPSFLTRSDVFVSWALPVMIDILRMLPIYRRRDGADFMEKNEEVFKIFVERLHGYESLIMFPEGNHNRQRKLRNPLKKGIARIGFRAAEETNFELPVHLVPVGLNYSHHRKFHTDMLIVYGEPLKLTDYYEAYKENPQRTIVNVVRDYETRLEKYMIHISKDDYHESIDTTRRIYSDNIVERTNRKLNDQHDHLLAEKELISKIESSIEAENPIIPEWDENVKSYSKKLKEMKFRDHVIQKGPYSIPTLLFEGILFLLLLPFHLLSVFIHYPFYKTAEQLAIKAFKDNHFHSSIMFLFGYALYPTYVFIWAGLTWIFINGWAALALLIAAPFLGKFAIKYSERFKKWWARWRYMLMGKNPKLTQLKSLRAKIVTAVDQMVEETVAIK